MSKTKKEKKIAKKASATNEDSPSWMIVLIKLIIVTLPIILATTFVIRLSTNDITMAKRDDHVSRIRSQNITCSADYKEHPVVPGCTPISRCSRNVIDGVITAEQVATLKNLLLKALMHGGSSGGASIINLHSGAMSMGDRFVNIHRLLKKEQLSAIFTKEDMKTYKEVKMTIKNLIASTYGIDPSVLHLTSPTFFSRMTSQEAKTQHDEYWHEHIDKIQYGSFDYTSLLYLSDYGVDFSGGRFIFDHRSDDKSAADIIIEPASGRVSFFTSGSENPHHVEKVEDGVRLALTVAFTCDVTKAIDDPSVVE